ncbi:MAG: HupE/UreJ family protein [Proteobacteria bacterium]|nr:HupE/UreJ family protein [Pseudomonadota bacterium]MBS0574461.1 HupE/UreJ family protein [Pseudomonadota bacterium]
MQTHAMPQPALWRRIVWLQSLILGLWLGLAATAASAHVFVATNAAVNFDRAASHFGMHFEINLEAILAGIDPEVKDTSESPNAQEYNRLRALPPEELKKAYEQFQPEFLAGLRFLVDGKPVPAKLVSVQFADVGDLTKVRKTNFEFQGDLPPGATTFAFGWEPKFGKVLLRTIAPHARSLHIEMIEKGGTSQPIVIDNVKSRTTIDMVVDFISVGYQHILPEGLDHILFVTGIFLLSTRMKPILMQVTAFTVAHTLTLGLGTAGIVNVPREIVEPLIAASIVYVAVENILSPNLSPWRPAVVFCFGLLHGLGFASALRDFNLANEDFLVGLLSFNVGVELGQLTIIAICFALVGIWFGEKPWYRQRVVIPGSLVIAAIGAFWFFQRVGLLA